MLTMVNETLEQAIARFTARGDRQITEEEFRRLRDEAGIDAAFAYSHAPGAEVVFFTSGEEQRGMTIFYHGKSVTLSEHAVCDFSITLGIAIRSPETHGDKLACVERARDVWTTLAVWGTRGPDPRRPAG